MLSTTNLAFVAGVGVTLLTGVPGTPPTSADLPPVTGRLTVRERNDRSAGDVQQAVVWLVPARGEAPRPAAVTVDVITEHKTFSPHVTVVTPGSTVRFPNRDGFNHNVFSLTESDPFDLGLYDRGEGKPVLFRNAGIVSVFCNVHSTMSAMVLVLPTPWWTQPNADGTFTLPGVPPGEYVLHAWHERAGESSQPVTVTAAGLALDDLTLDARGYVARGHLNKYGRPYARTGRRY